MKLDFSDIGIKFKPKKKSGNKRSAKSTILLVPIGNKKWKELDLDHCTPEEFTTGLKKVTNGMLGASDLTETAADSPSGRQRVLHDLIEIQKQYRTMFKKPSNM